MTFAVYPGLIARASLKRLCRAAKRVWNRGLPGLNCPGLIEAPRGGDRALGWTRVYPGLIARASLKLRRRTGKLERDALFTRA